MATGTAGAGRPFPAKPPAVAFEGMQPMSSLRISPSGVRHLGLALLLGSTAAHAGLTVDPRDGRMPPLTREPQRHLAQPDGGLDLVNTRPRTAASSFSNGPFDGPEDLSLLDRCITRGLPGSMLPFLHVNSYQIV